MRSRVVLGAVAIALGCSGGPPRFSVELAPAARGEAADARWVSIGSLATPPPGRYRFLRLQAGGDAELREVHAVNGPGPWPTYIGRARVTPAIAADAVQAVAAGTPTASPGSGTEPCVLAFGTGALIEWQGCAFFDVARRVLDDLPSLAAPDVSPACADPICQLRLIDGTTPVGHAAQGSVRREVVFDSGGALWCAAAPDDRSMEDGVLRVERAAIAAQDSAAVFGWLTRGLGDARPPPLAPDVMVRGAGMDWGRVSDTDGRELRSRWQQLAPDLPRACR